MAAEDSKTFMNEGHRKKIKAFWKNFARECEDEITMEKDWNQWTLTYRNNWAAERCQVGYLTKIEAAALTVRDKIAISPLGGDYWTSGNINLMHRELEHMLMADLNKE